MRQVIDRAADIAVQDPERPTNLRSKATHGQILVEKQRGNASAGDQVVQIVVEFGQFKAILL